MMGWEAEEVIKLREQDQIHTQNRRKVVAETVIGTWWYRQELLPSRNEAIAGMRSTA